MGKFVFRFVSRSIRGLVGDDHEVKELIIFWVETIYVTGTIHLHEWVGSVNIEVGLGKSLDFMNSCFGGNGAGGRLAEGTRGVCEHNHPENIEVKAGFDVRRHALRAL